MKRTLILIAFLACGCLLAADTTNSEGQAGYIIEGDGEFGKELKELVKKHSKDGNVSVNIYKAKANEVDNRLINIGVNPNQNFNLARGEEAYNKHCAHCHGQKGEKRPFGTSRRLSELTGKQIADLVGNYAANPNYGGKNKHIMRPAAVRVSHRDLGDIVSYLKGENALIFSDEGNEPISTKPTEQGTYIE